MLEPIKIASCKTVRCFFLALFVMLIAVNASAGRKANDHNFTQPVRSLIERIAPGKSTLFSLKIIKTNASSADSFFIKNYKGKIEISGTNTIALAKGFNYYLKNYCHTTVSWYLRDKVVLPAQMPTDIQPFGQASRFQSRFFLNYCTFGYTMLWWHWDDWQRLIDWMALNGINMPLAITGQEYIWQKVWKKFGMTEEASRNFFTGPAHLPWQRMGNLDRWLGPLPQSFIDGQFVLAKQILKRERAFGMQPILPAFAGHVPYDLKKIYPNIQVTDLGSYQTGKENDAYFLNPMDSLFTKIQVAYLSEQEKLLGTNHLYGADPFNEMTPPSWEPDYLANVAKTIYAGMQTVDKQATWVQMGWTFFYERDHWTNSRLKAMIKAVPPNKMIILDYFGERVELWRSTEAFFGAPYIWCYLGNFGGNTQLAAPLLNVSKLLDAAQNDPHKGQMLGVGSTLEGFGVNDFMMDWLFDFAWNKDATNTTSWIKSYADARCGHADKVVRSAWEQMLPLVYNKQVSGVGLGNIIQSVPMLKGTGYFSQLSKYDYSSLARLLPVWLSADAQSKADPSFQKDLTLVEKQVLVNLASNFRDSIAKYYQTKNKELVASYCSKFLSLCDDVNTLMATQNDMLLGKWIEDARSFGKTKAEKDFYERDARVLLTTWGGKGNHLIGYAGKDWAGLITSFYKKRWQMFFDYLKQTMETGSKPDMNAFDKRREQFDWDWATENFEKDAFSSKPEGDPIDVCTRLYHKWAMYL